MRQILTKIANVYVMSEDGQRDLVHFIEMRKHPGWKTYRGFLLHIGNNLANEVMSPAFQKLPEREKLVRLEAYSMLGDAIKFLMDPIPRVERASQLKQRTKEATSPPERKRPRRKE